MCSRGDSLASTTDVSASRAAQAVAPRFEHGCELA